MRSRLSTLGVVVATGFSVGCNSFDEKAEEGSGARLIIPVDERPPVQAAEAPVPISGGTLAVTADGRFAVAADPSRDTLSIVDLGSRSVSSTIALEAGDEPGRIVEGATGRVHVALRRGGAVLTVDTSAGAIVGRTAVCKAPRGLAYDGVKDDLHVACSEGTLVSLDATTLAVTRSVSLDVDLRDVMVRGDELWVTRFKSAELLRVDAAGEVAVRTAPPEIDTELTVPSDDGDNFGAIEQRLVRAEPNVAWRAVPTAEGGAVIVHQHSVEDEVELTEPSASGSAYGGGGGSGCGGIVKDSVTIVAPDGAVRSTQNFAGGPLPVDVAVSPNGSWLAVAHAGLSDLGAPRPFVVFPGEDGLSGGGVADFGRFGGGVSLLSVEGVSFDSPCNFGDGSIINEPVVAVAFSPEGNVVAQTLEPPQVLVVESDGFFPSGEPAAIALPGESRADTGHDIFHRDSGGGIACASCHPEGGEDGHVWKFAGIGARRTQALHVGLRGTAPFHWDGDLDDFGALMTEVFVGRMGGVRQSRERLSVLTDFLFSIERPPAIRDSSDAAVVRGKAIFHSKAADCSSCHTGKSLTNNTTVAVGTLPKEGKLQVPSLVAVGYRAPFMHDGCAETLAGRFDAACGGGESHGHTAQLDSAEIGDLVAYLESL